MFMRLVPSESGYNFTLYRNIQTAPGVLELQISFALKLGVLDGNLLVTGNDRAVDVISVSPLYASNANNFPCGVGETRMQTGKKN
jgi:hypothetical protein